MITSAASNPEAFAAFVRIARAELPVKFVTENLDKLLTSRNFTDLPSATLTAKQKQRCDLSWKTGDDDALVDRCARQNIKVIWSQNSERPNLLQHSECMPPFVFACGCETIAHSSSVAIVGTRNASNYAAEQTARFAHYLAEHGQIIVSGGAKGIDTIAHSEALRCHMPTIAVVATGLLKTYPRDNKVLFEKIVLNGGLIISEYAPEAGPEPWKFPNRNRIIAALSKITLITEAGDKSGALITAGFAATYGRDVFVIPGPIDSGNNEGGHGLIRDGAQLVTHPSQLLPQSQSLFEPGMVPDERMARARISLTDTEKKVMAMIPSAGVLTAVILETSHLPLSESIAVITILEIKGAIRREPGGLLVPA